MHECKHTCIYIYIHMYHIYVCTYEYRYIILYTYICVNINYSNCYGKEWNTPKFLPVEPGDLFAFLTASHLDKVLAVLFGFLPEWRTERTLAYFSWLVKWGHTLKKGMKHYGQSHTYQKWVGIIFSPCAGGDLWHCVRHIALISHLLQLAN
jgi:hypothetical protein